MTTTNGNRKILDLKRWEMVTPAPTATVAAACVISSRCHRQQQLYLVSATVAYLYNPYEDGWVQLPSPALAGLFGAGTCGVGTAVGPTGTATAGTTTTLTTNLTLARSLTGYNIHITAGPNAGLTIPIVSNTVGANSVITVATQSTAFTVASTYRLLTPRFFVLNAGTQAAGSFRYFCLALNTWTSLAITGIPATWGTDGRLMSTPSWMGSGYLQFATGTATSATGTTLVTIGKTWTTSQWVNSQVRIVAGTGAGQIRTITANDATSLTVATWTITPDATSSYSIEGNDDNVYIMGNAAVALYKFSIAGNTTSTLAPAAARAAAPTTGASGHWIWGADTASWINESAIINGRRLYSFRAGAGAILDYYDIAANTWVSAVLYSPAVETFASGTKWIYSGGDYMYIEKEATGRWFRYNIVTQEMDGWSTMLYPQGAAILGDTAFDVTYTDGATNITYNYMLLNTSAIMLRQMVI